VNQVSQAQDSSSRRKKTLEQGYYILLAKVLAIEKGARRKKFSRKCNNNEVLSEIIDRLKSN